jgi:multicomponent Na+:H+ antiporter subunit F
MDGLKQLWQLASVGLLPPLLCGLLAAGRGRAGMRLIAVQLVSSLGTLLLLALTFAFDAPSSVDVALTLAVLSLPGVVVLLLFFERWL